MIVLVLVLVALPLPSQLLLRLLSRRVPSVLLLLPPLGAARVGLLPCLGV